MRDETLAALSPARLIGVDHWTGSHFLLQLLIGRLSSCCHPVEQPDDATMADGESILPFQSILNESPEESIHRGHRCDGGYESRTEPTPSDSPGLQADRRWQDPLPTPGTLPPDNSVLSDLQGCRYRQINHLNPALDPAGAEMLVAC
jgi:hypothetical protein